MGVPVAFSGTYIFFGSDAVPAAASAIKRGTLIITCPPCRKPSTLALRFFANRVLHRDERMLRWRMKSLAPGAFFIPG